MGFAGAPRLRAVIALAALLAAACSGGGPPPAAPEAPSVPPPTAAAAPSAPVTPAPTAAATPDAASTPAPPPPATPAPEARSGLDLVEPAPGAFEHRTFEDGEAIDWTHGTFFLDAETGRTEGYAVAGVEGGWRYHGDRDGWIEARRITGGWRLLVDRTTDLSWRWPGASLLLDAVSDDHLLFQDMSDGNPTGRFALANRRMEEVTRFAVDPGSDWPNAMFSPDGRTMALESGGTVYLIPVRPSGPPEVLVTPAPYGVALGPSGDDGFSVTSWLGAGEVKKQHFSWEGVALPAPEPDPGSACARGDSVPFRHAPKLSPDGRYAATLEGGPYYDKEVGGWVTEIPWPTIVVSDAETCAPIFRVRSAYIYQYFWQTAWLSSSEGIVLSTNTGYAIALVRPFPALIPLPSGQPGPEPAPTGDGRYFAYGSRVYDAVADRWRGPSGVGRVWYSWEDSHHERRFEIGDTPLGETRINWLLLPPKIDFPPFRDGIAFRVERTGSCLRIREEPGEAGRVLGCLPDGERLTFVEHDVLSHFLNTPPLRRGSGGEGIGERPWPHPSIAVRDSSLWVYVRTAGGAEGWASHDWLGHD